MHVINDRITVGSLSEALDTEALIARGYRAFISCGAPMPPLIPNILFGKTPILCLTNRLLIVKQKGPWLSLSSHLNVTDPVFT